MTLRLQLELGRFTSKRWPDAGVLIWKGMSRGETVHSGLLFLAGTRQELSHFQASSLIAVTALLLVLMAGMPGLYTAQWELRRAISGVWVYLCIVGYDN